MQRCAADVCVSGKEMQYSCRGPPSWSSAGAFVVPGGRWTGAGCGQTECGYGDSGCSLCVASVVSAKRKLRGWGDQGLCSVSCGCAVAGLWGHDPPCGTQVRLCMCHIWLPLFWFQVLTNEVYLFIRFLMSCLSYQGMFWDPA